MVIIYENSFNWNEWFIIGSLVLFILIIVVTPKIFSLLEGIGYYIFGVSIGMFYDHTISLPPWDFYDVNDSSAYQFMDFLSYLMYGPYSYFFLYLYKKLKIKGMMNLVYIMIWTSFSLLMEWFSLHIGVFHYEKGYHSYWSIPIYMLVQSIQLLFYHKVVRSKKV